MDELKKQLNDLKLKSDRDVRRTTISMMTLQKAIVQKVQRPHIKEEGEGDYDEVHEGVYSGPFTRKSTIIKKKVKFNNQLIDPDIMNKPDWELTAKEKYQKSILEHYKNIESMKDKEKKMNYRDSNAMLYGSELIMGDKDEGVSKE